DTYVCIPTLAKGGSPGCTEVGKVASLRPDRVKAELEKTSFVVPSERLSSEAWALKSDRESALFAKILRKGNRLGDYVHRKMFYGIKTGLNEAFEISDAQLAAIRRCSPNSTALIKPFVGGQNIRRYHTDSDVRFLIVLPAGWTKGQMQMGKPAR